MAVYHVAFDVGNASAWQFAEVNAELLSICLAESIQLHLAVSYAIVNFMLKVRLYSDNSQLLQGYYQHMPRHACEGQWASWLGLALMPARKGTI